MLTVIKIMSSPWVRCCFHTCCCLLFSWGAGRGERGGGGSAPLILQKQLWASPGLLVGLPTVLREDYRGSPLRRGRRQ